MYFFSPKTVEARVLLFLNHVAFVKAQLEKLFYGIKGLSNRRKIRFLSRLLNALFS